MLIDILVVKFDCKIVKNNFVMLVKEESLLIYLNNKTYVIYIYDFNCPYKLLFIVVLSFVTVQSNMILRLALFLLLQHVMFLTIKNMIPFNDLFY